MAIQRAMPRANPMPNEARRGEAITPVPCPLPSFSLSLEELKMVSLLRDGVWSLPARAFSSRPAEHSLRPLGDSYHPQVPGFYLSSPLFSSVC